MEKNQFRLADVILSVICVVFVAEAAAPVASIGNSQYFWWGFMILAFLLPYGLIAAELGTAYAGDGGLYDWIHAAYPQGKWAARASWYYWINFPLWMASLAVMCPELLRDITGRQMGTIASLADGAVVLVHAAALSRHLIFGLCLIRNDARLFAGNSRDLLRLLGSDESNILNLLTEVV